jgi:hypothetical protein
VLSFGVLFFFVGGSGFWGFGYTAQNAGKACDWLIEIVGYVGRAGSWYNTWLMLLVF